MKPIGAGGTGLPKGLQFETRKQFFRRKQNETRPVKTVLKHRLRGALMAMAIIVMILVGAYNCCIF